MRHPFLLARGPSWGGPGMGGLTDCTGLLRRCRMKALKETNN